MCNVGFHLQDENTCVGKSVCLSSVCNQSCRNTEGSFECMCNVGYNLQDGHTCVGKAVCLSVTKDVGTQRAAKSVCVTLDSICKSNIHVWVCLSVCNHGCRNTEDSYECMCNVGYNRQDEHTCVGKSVCLSVCLKPRL